MGARVDYISCIFFHVVVSAAPVFRVQLTTLCACGIVTSWGGSGGRGVGVSGRGHTLGFSNKTTGKKSGELPLACLIPGGRSVGGRSGVSDPFGL